LKKEDLGGFNNRQAEGIYGKRSIEPPGLAGADAALSGNQIVTA
jgi:hypothetical protein